RAALRDPAFKDRMLRLVTQGKSILEIAVVSTDGDEVLFSTIPAHIGHPAPKTPEFEPLVTKSGLIEKLKVLLNKSPEHYKLDEPMGSSGVTFFNVRVVIDPAFLQHDLVPTLEENARIAILSVIGAVALTFVFSTIAFRTLGQIGHMLDLVAKGEFEPDKL